MDAIRAAAGATRRRCRCRALRRRQQLRAGSGWVGGWMGWGVNRQQRARPPPQQQEIWWISKGGTGRGSLEPLAETGSGRPRAPPSACARLGSAPGQGHACLAGRSSGKWTQTQRGASAARAGFCGAGIVFGCLLLLLLLLLLLDPLLLLLFPCS